MLLPLQLFTWLAYNQLHVAFLLMLDQDFLLEDWFHIILLFYSIQDCKYKHDIPADWCLSLQASVRHVHLISARLATPASSSDQNWTFTIFTISDNNNVVSNVFLNLELVVGRLDTQSVDPAEMCLQLNLNHFVQVRLPWEPGLGISHNKTKDCHRREQKPRRIQIFNSSAPSGPFEASIDWRWRWGGAAAQSTNLTWSRSDWSVLQWSFIKYFPTITGSLNTYL